MLPCSDAALPSPQPLATAALAQLGWPGGSTLGLLLILGALARLFLAQEAAGCLSILLQVSL